MRIKHFVTFIVVILAVAGSAVAVEINSFDDCANAGYPVLESYPRQCITPDGRRFIEVLAQQKGKTKPCARENQMCGGIAGILCCPGLMCELAGNFPDAGGVCKRGN